MVADEEGNGDSDGERGGAEEVRAAEQVGAEGLHGWLAPGASGGGRRGAFASSRDDADAMGSRTGSGE